MDGAGVVGFDVVEFGVGKERADEAGDEVGGEVGDIRIEVADDVSAGDVEGFPEVFAFAGVGSGFRGDFGGEVGGGSGVAGDFEGVVGGVGVNNEEFVDEGVFFDEVLADDFDDGADGGGFVKGGDADGDFLGFFEGDEVGDVGELGVVEGLGHCFIVKLEVGDEFRQIFH